MNEFTLTLARLTRDPEVKYTPTQVASCNLMLAVDTGYGDKKRTDFPRVTVWGKTAEGLDKYTAKGLRVNVYGHIQTGSYQKDGKTIYTTDLIADRVEYVDFKDRDTKNHEEKPKDPEPPAFKEIEADIPF